MMTLRLKLPTKYPNRCLKVAKLPIDVANQPCSKSTALTSRTANNLRGRSAVTHTWQVWWTVDCGLEPVWMVRFQTKRSCLLPEIPFVNTIQKYWPNMTWRWSIGTGKTKDRFLPRNRWSKGEQRLWCRQICRQEGQGLWEIQKRQVLQRISFRSGGVLSYHPIYRHELRLLRPKTFWEDKLCRGRVGLAIHVQEWAHLTLPCSILCKLWGKTTRSQIFYLKRAIKINKWLVTCSSPIFKTRELRNLKDIMVILEP